MLAGNPSFADLSYKFFDSFNSQRLRPNSDYFRLNHFTDLLRLLQLPKELPPRVLFQGPGNDVLLFSAKQLAEIDIKFKASASMRYSPLGLKFSNEVLECRYPYQHYLSDYELLLDCLINSQEDVNVLIRNGIIRNSLGDPSEVVRIFDGLSTDLTLSGTSILITLGFAEL
ncbi:hypothetical protein K1719_013756 [Acacia pycnantha]|nr:hypothetical protein K1719_013756 [Acacia pycnantha]